MRKAEELVQSYYEAFNMKDTEAMLKLLTDDVIHYTNQGSRSVGKDAFKEFLADMDLYYDEHLTDITIMTNSSGNRVAAEFVCHGTYKSTCNGLPQARGQKYSLPVGCFFEIRDGKIARVTNYYNLTDWLEQVT